MYKGEVALDSEGWFEGLVHTPGVEDKEYFVCGVFHPGKAIVIYKFSSKESGISPMTFVGETAEYGFTGENRTCCFQILTQEDTLEDAMVIDLRVVEWKSQMGKLNHSFYDDCYQNRQETSRRCLENYRREFAKYSKENGGVVSVEEDRRYVIEPVE